MNSSEELEQMTLKFLRENDPYFLDKKRKIRLIYNYHSDWSMNQKQKTEISLSNLTDNQRYETMNDNGKFD